MMNTNFEQEYEDVLHNIEAAITSVYREHDDLSDHLVDKAIEGLVRVYQAELKGRNAPTLKFGELDQLVYNRVNEICQLHLGRIKLEEEIELEAITVEEIVACLKRIRSSISMWTKDYGRKGYLDFVNKFIE